MDAELMAEIGREMERLEDLVVDLRAENERLREAMVDMAMTLNKTAEYQVAELMAENDRLREALEGVMLQDEYECIRGGVKVKDWGLCGQIAKEALK